ncbi:MAG: Trigger factor [Candidatus Giovannonibacteria bacterium GW2011_GWA2_53_7]|uniref:Trigger factor n=1 Tax=Candidatus Giovannonibacteria bacterium GW2011_GWA2_53_7 TaxID=1618650 RepID=A0A0G1XYL4_9BACT|nr:MAG: Trigger factor [Candidatus Giovannonibacteria bacterium GW2011_GWA2_53_7]
MTNPPTTAYSATVKKLPRSIIEMTVSVSPEVFDAARPHALEHIGEELELPGFRKGHAPANIVAQKAGEAAILEEMAEHIISRAYPKILVEHKIDAIGRPDVSVTKLAPGNALEFTIKVATVPEVKLPDYMSIARGQNKKRAKVELTDEDIKKTTEEVRTLSARRIAEKEGKPFDPEGPLPELTDDFVKTLGDYSSVADFTEKARGEILKEKERVAKEKHRMGIIEGVLEKTDIDLPEIIIEQELDRMTDEFAADIERMGMELDKYLEIIKKTREDLRKDWNKDAEKRGKVQLLVAEIARKENIEPATEDLEHEMNKLHILYPNASLERMRAYVDMVLTNELVFKKLEEAE